MTNPRITLIRVLFFIFFFGMVMMSSYIATASGPLWAKIVTTLLILALVILGYVMGFVIPISRPGQTIAAYIIGVVLLILIAWMLRYFGINLLG